MEQPNVLFIVMDTARAQDSLPSANREIVPNLADLAESGVEFTSAISNAPWTLPSHASIFTGKYTSDHNTNAGNKRFDPGDFYLPKMVNESGYTTVAFSNNSWVSSEFGFRSGFDDFYNGWEIFPSNGNLVQAMREKDTPTDQISSLINSTDINSFPKDFMNAFYTKFLRKQYDYGAYVTNWRVKKWIKDKYTGNKPFFMFINYIEPHLKYDPPKDFCKFMPDGMGISEAKQVKQDPWGYVSGELTMSENDFDVLKGLYKSEISYLDYRIGNLLNYLSEHQILNDTLVVVIGDHGENIGEHKLMDHQYSLYDTVVHVPLVIKGPDIFTGGEKVSQVVESRDLFPTILSATGSDIPDQSSISHNNLFNVLHNKNDRGSFAISEYLVPQPPVEKLRARSSDSSSVNKYDRALHAIRTTKWKYIEGSDGSKELYYIESDPSESTNVADSYPEIVDQLQKILFTEVGPLKRGTADDSQLDAGAQQRLEDLGYL